MTRAELLQHMAWKIRNSKDMKKAALDLLSELDRSPQWRDAADRLQKAPTASWKRFLSELTKLAEDLSDREPPRWTR